MNVADVAGWIGAINVLAAYYSLAAGLATRSPAVDACNFVGSFGLAAAALHHHNLSSLSLNTLWGLIAAAAFTRHATPGPDSSAVERTTEPSGCGTRPH
jgi:hypothetical protein